MRKTVLICLLWAIALLSSAPNASKKQEKDIMADVLVSFTNNVNKRGKDYK